MNIAELQKRSAIKKAKVQDPTLTTRALARQFKTSLRVVGDALSMDVDDWKELIAASKPVSPTLVILGKPPSKVSSNNDVVEKHERHDQPRRFDPERDLDPDDYRSMN